MNAEQASLSVPDAARELHKLIEAHMPWHSPAQLRAWDLVTALAEAQPEPQSDQDHLAESSKVDRCVPLLDALRHIAEPVEWEQDNVREGYELDYPMLMHMLNDPEYYKRVAREALQGEGA